MKGYIFLFLMVVLGAITLKAQTRASGQYTVRGQVIDSLANETVPYATLSIALTQNPGQPVRMLACDADGKFETQLKDTGNYVMVIRSIGKANLTKEFTLSETDKTVNLGKLYMLESAQAIGEVTVSAQRPLVNVEIDKIIYNMEDDPEAQVNNVLEMLRKVPMVTVDGEDKVQLKGSSNFKIYLNGKPSNMLSGQNVSDVLKSMPANSVKNIEVITDPGVRYDAEGIGGIINIVTNRNTFQGYSGSVSANAGTYGGFGGGAYITTKVGKVGVTGNLNMNRYKRPWGETESISENFINPDYYKGMDIGRNRNKGLYRNGNLEVSYEIDTLNLISLGVNMYGGDYENISERGIEMFNISDVVMYEYDRDGESKSKYGSTGVNFDYQRSTKKKDELLTFSYRFRNSPDGSEIYSYVNNITGEPPSHLTLSQWHENDAATREHTAQIDYTNPINKNHGYETGIKYILRQNLSEVEQHEMNPGDTQWTLLPKKPNDDFRHTSHIYAAYLGYSYKTDKLGFKAGLRAEGTQQNVEFELDEVRNFDTDYFNVVPSITASYKLGKTQQLRLGYSLRIYRPGIWYLNPYVNDTDPFNISYGNPDLEVEKSNNINLNYNYFSPKFNINASASYSYVNNSIESYTFINEADPNIKERTYDNIGKNQRVALYMNFGWTPVKTFRLNFNGGLNYSEIESKELGTSNDGLNGNFFASAQISLPKDFRINLNGMYYSGWVMLQGSYSSQYFTSIAVNKDFLKKKLTVSLSCTNPFTEKMTYKYSTKGENFEINNVNKMKNREARLSVSYRFGTMKSAIKKVQRGISNDDVKGGGDSGGGSGGGTSGGGAG